MKQRPVSIVFIGALICLIGAGCANKKDVQNVQLEQQPQVKQADTATKTETKTKSTTTTEDGEKEKSSEDDTSSAKIKENPKNPVNKKTDKEQQGVGQNIILNGSVLGPHTALFTWEVSQNTAEESEGYKIVRGTGPEPTDPAGWWWQRGPSHREHTWGSLPEGVAYFRICIIKNEVCTDYSNAIKLTIPPKTSVSNPDLANTGGPEHQNHGKPCPHKHSRKLTENFFAAIQESELKKALELVDPDTVQTTEFKQIWEKILELKPETIVYKKLFHNVSGNKKRKDVDMIINQKNIFRIETTKKDCEWWITAIHPQ